MRRVKFMVLCSTIYIRQIDMNIKKKISDSIIYNREIIDSFAAVALGIIIGASGSKFAAHAINDRVLETCPITRLIQTTDPFLGKRYFCAE